MSEDAESPSSRRILIFGAAGQLGRALRASFAGAGSITAVGRDTVDLADAAQLRACIAQAAPHVILNAAAYTAVDRAESEPQLAYAINADAPRIMAEEARARNALLVHYSTDYVFDGSKRQPWSEDDAPNPLSVYGASKLAGEQLRSNPWRTVPDFPHQLGVRAAWQEFPAHHAAPGPRARPASDRDDQFGAPTTSIELADATRAVIEACLREMWSSREVGRAVSHDVCRIDYVVWLFASHLRAGSADGRQGAGVDAIETKDYPTPAKRPRNSVLSNDKLNERLVFGWRSGQGSG